MTLAERIAAGIKALDRKRTPEELAAARERFCGPLHVEVVADARTTKLCLTLEALHLPWSFDTPECVMEEILRRENEHMWDLFIRAFGTRAQYNERCTQDGNAQPARLPEVMDEPQPGLGVLLAHELRPERHGAWRGQPLVDAPDRSARRYWLRVASPKKRLIDTQLQCRQSKLVEERAVALLRSHHQLIERNHFDVGLHIRSVAKVAHVIARHSEVVSEDAKLLDSRRQVANDVAESRDIIGVRNRSPLCGLHFTSPNPVQVLQRPLNWIFLLARRSIVAHWALQLDDDQRRVGRRSRF